VGQQGSDRERSSVDGGGVRNVALRNAGERRLLPTSISWPASRASLATSRRRYSSVALAVGDKSAMKHQLLIAALAALVMDRVSLAVRTETERTQEGGSSKMCHSLTEALSEDK